MAQLSPNMLMIRRALNGARAVYSIAKHPKLHLAVDGKGGGSWRIKYRPAPGATQRWMTLSNDARNADFDEIVRKAGELLTALSLEGADPKRTRPTAESTFGDTFMLWLERHGKVHKKSWQEDQNLYRRHIEGRLGVDPISKVDRQRVIEVLDDIAAKATPIQANRCQTVISSVFSWALDEGRINSHPAMRIRKRGAETARDLVMDDEQLKRFWDASGKQDPHIMRILKLLLLLGSRLSEVVEAEVKEFSKNGAAQWEIPAARSKNNLPHIVPLPPAATEIVQAAVADAGRSKFLFPAQQAELQAFDKKFVSRLCKRIFREIGADDMLLHDLRHQAATGMAKCGVPLDIRQMVQNQVSGRRQAIGALYDQHDYINEKLRALTLWEMRLMAIVEGREIPIERY